MRDLSFLTEPHEPQTSPGLETSDEQLASISMLADEGDFATAADRVEALVSEKVFDIRLIVFLLHDATLQGGFDALAAGLEGLLRFLQDNDGALGPAERKQAHIARSVRWLLETTADTINYEQQRSTERWHIWQSKVTAATCRRVLDAMQALIYGAGEATVQATAESSARIARWLRDTTAQLDVEEARHMSSDEESKVAPEAQPPQEAAAPARLDVSAAPLTCEVRGSTKLVDLLRKLEAFENLVDRKAYERAALVGDDVMGLLDSFDPREYFPELFSQFGALLSAHVEDITPHWQHKDSVRWRMLEQFYKVDLERFEKET